MWNLKPLRVMVIVLPVVLAAALAAGRAAAQQPVVIDHPASSTAPIQLSVGRSGILLFDTPVERASVNDAAVVEVVVVSPTQLLLHGKQPGATSVVVWQAGSNQLINVMVEPDLEPLRQLLREILPGEPIEVRSASDRLVLMGEASSEEARERAVTTAESYSEKVVNLVGVKAQPVVIEVRFAEINRTLAKSLGVDYIAQAGDFTQGGFIGQGLTPQLPATPRFGRVSGGKDLSLSSTITEIFELRRGTDVGIALRALEEQGLIRILAEPNLVANSGEQASFLAGGEFPIPVVQSTTGGAISNAVTIEFKEFGIRLNFKPDVVNDEEIRLFVEPEVSVLDFSTAAVKLGGFEIPGLVTRRASTTVQMRSGESLAIGGLLSQMHTRTDDRIPWLGSVPILGKLFSSERFKREETELLVLVTPRLVRPTVLPTTAAPTGPEQLQRVIEQHQEAAPYPDAQGEAIREAIQGLHHE